MNLEDQRRFTVALAVATFVRQWNVTMAANLLAIIPFLIVYFLAQKRSIDGIASVGIKG